MISLSPGPHRHRIADDDLNPPLGPFRVVRRERLRVTMIRPLLGVNLIALLTSAKSFFKIFGSARTIEVEGY